MANKHQEPTLANQCQRIVEENLSMLRDLSLESLTSKIGFSETELTVCGQKVSMLLEIKKATDAEDEVKVVVEIFQQAGLVSVLLASDGFIAGANDSLVQLSERERW